MKKLIWTCLLSLFCGIMSVNTAFAQEAGKTDQSKDEKKDENIVSLEEFEVTEKAIHGWVSSETVAGLRAAQKLIDVPQHIDIATRSFLDDISAIDTATAVQYTSGGTANKSRWADDFLVRGIRTTFTALDGFANVEKTITPPSMVQRIETTKGPASILYGGASQAGATINRVLKTPTQTKQGEIKFEAGTDDWYAGMLDLSGPIQGHEKIQYRFIAEARRAGGTRFGVERDDQLIFSPALSFDIGKKSKLTVRYQYFDRKFHNARVFLDPDVFPEIKILRGVAWNSPDSEPHRTIISHDIYINFTSAITKNIGMRVAFLEQISARPTLRAVGNTHKLKESPAGGLTWDVTRSHQKQLHHNKFIGYQVDFTVKNGFFNSFLQSRLNFGAEHNHNEQDFLFSLPKKNLPFDVKNPQYPEQEPGAVYSDFWRFFRFEDRGNTFTGVYAQESLSLWEGRLSFTGGARYNYTHKSTFRRWQGADPATGGIDPDTGFYDPNFPNSNPGDTSGVWTGRWGIVAKPFKGFQNISFFGGFNETFLPAGGADFAGNLFGPTRSQNREFGAKLDFFKGLSGTISYFNLDIIGLKRKDPDNFGFDIQDQSNTSTGFDMSLSYINKGISAIVTYYNGDVTNQDGSQPSSSPNQTFSFFTKYDFTGGSLKGFTLGLGGKFQEASPSNRAFDQDGNRIFQPSTWDFDLFTAYAWGQYKIQVNVSNLTDAVIWGEMFEATNNVILDGRRVKVTLSYRW